MQRLLDPADAGGPQLYEADGDVSHRSEHESRRLGHRQPAHQRRRGQPQSRVAGADCRAQSRSAGRARRRSTRPAARRSSTSTATRTCRTCSSPAAKCCPDFSDRARRAEQDAFSAALRHANPGFPERARLRGEQVQGRRAEARVEVRRPHFRLPVADARDAVQGQRQCARRATSDGAALAARASVPTCSDRCWQHLHAHSGMTTIAGPKVTLKRARATDRARIYEWLIGSDLTAAHDGRRDVSGPSDSLAGRVHCDLPGALLRRDAAVCRSHADHQRERRGHRLRLARRDRPHERCRRARHLAGRAPRWRGRATAPRRWSCCATGCRSNYGVNRFLVRPSRRNVKALRAMRRAGFRETDLPAQEVVSKLIAAAGQLRRRSAAVPHPSVPSPVLRPDPTQTYVFIDSEFTRPDSPQLISVGAVATDSTAFYAELQGWEPGARERIRQRHGDAAARR